MHSVEYSLSGNCILYKLLIISGMAIPIKIFTLMGTCPASSHVKASEVISGTSRPMVYLESLAFCPKPTHELLSVYLTWEAAWSFDCGFMLFLGNVSRGQSGSWSAAICHCLSDEAFNRLYHRKLSHSSYRDLTSLWKSHWPPLQISKTSISV